MKRDPEIERQILLTLEAWDNRSNRPDLSGIPADDFVVGYHLRLLNDVGLIQAADTPHLQDRFAMIPIRLTMHGHEYLDRVRDPEIWRETKSAADSVGNFSLELLSALAKGFVKKKVEQHTGVELDL